MISKKALYQPAPEHPLHSSLSSLPQGETSVTVKNGPTIKQGVSETRKGHKPKPLTSTLKTTMPNRKLVVSHNPTVVHSYIKESDSNTELAQDTVATPNIVVIPAVIDKSFGKGARQKQNASNSTAGRFVKSRYKQASSKVALGKLNSSPSASKTSCNSSRSRENSRKESSTNHSLRTPIVKSNQGKTSTPSSGNRPRPEFDWNASAIEKSSSVSSSLSPAKPGYNPETVFEDEEDVDLDILYCRYIQWHHLHSRVKNETAQKAKPTTKELEFLHNKNTETDQELEELEKEVMQLEHQYELEKQLELQKTGLGPVADKLQTVLGAFSTLAQNLDTTRHNLPLIDAFVPDQDSLEVTLDETRNLLGQINIMTHSQAPVINQMSHNASALRKGCEENVTTITTTKEEMEKEISSAVKQASQLSQLKLTRP